MTLLKYLDRMIHEVLVVSVGRKPGADSFYRAAREQGLQPERLASIAAHSGSEPAIRVIETSEQLLAASQAWRSLHDADPHASVFTSWEWLHAWWNHYGRKRQLHVLLADAGDRLVGILPLYLTRSTTLGVPHRVLRLLGSGGDTTPDYLGPILAETSTRTTARAFARHLFEPSCGWDVLHLADMAEDSPGARALADECSCRAAGADRCIAARIWCGPLAQSWDEFLAGLSAHRRKHVRNVRSKAERVARARLVVARAPEELNVQYDRLVNLHRRRFGARGVRHSFSSSEYVSFHRDAILACGRRGWVRLYMLQLEDEITAALYCYLYRNCLFVYQVGMNPHWISLRPGSVLTGYAVENAIGEQARALDFLRGEHEYKKEWSKLQRSTFTVSLYRGGVRSSVWRLAHKRIPALKAWLALRVPFLTRAGRHD